MTDERSYDDMSEDPRVRDRSREGETVREPVAPSESAAQRTQADTTYGTSREPTRTEPMQRDPIESHRTARTTTTGLWPEMTDYQRRFDDIQSQFIEDPRSAVKNAEQLVEDAIQRMTTTMRERMQGMHHDAENGDTEKLRVEMKALRDFITSLSERRAA